MFGLNKVRKAVSQGRSARRVAIEGLEGRRLFAAFTVTTLVDGASDTGSLRYAINQVNANRAAGTDSITFAPGLRGSIALTGGTLSISRVSGPVTVTGPGAANLTIDGLNASQIFSVKSGATVSVSRLTLSNGNTTVNVARGGAIGNEGGNVTVTDTAFVGNRSYEGGAIGNSPNSTLSVVNSTFTNNSNMMIEFPGGDGDFVGGDGGAIANFGGFLTVTGSTFTGNTALGIGGAIYNVGNLAGTITGTISGSTFARNSARLGGAIGNSVFGRLTITGSTFSSNTASLGGRSIYVQGSATLTLRTSNITTTGGVSSGEILVAPGGRLLSR